MMTPTYGRNKQILSDDAPKSEEADSQPSASQGVRIDGFQQVIELLRVADPAFRRSLLERIMAQDPHLARNLQADLARRG